MSFPERPSLARDNRDSWREHRRDMRSRHVANSSISPGEGSLDILDAAGDVVSSVGHANNKAGLVFKNADGAWTTPQEESSRTEGRLTANETAISTERARNDTQWSHIDSHANHIAGLQTRMSTAETRIAEETSRNDLQWTVIDQRTARIAALESALSTAQADIADLKRRVSDLERGPITP